MTDYEAASLAAQHASLAAQHTALWIAAVAAVGTFVSALASAAAAAGIWYGIRAMIRANKERAVILDRQREDDDKRHEATMAAHAEAMAKADQRHEEAMAAHAETMAAFAQQHQADERRHEENMTALKAMIAGLERQTASLERQTASLETVVERTAPGPAPAE